MRYLLFLVYLCSYASLNAGEATTINADTWERNYLIPPLTKLAQQQQADGTWRDPQSGRDLTAEVSIAMIVCGFDHRTPNRFHHHLAQSMSVVLSRTVSDQRPLAQRALDIMLIVESFAMTGDENLREPSRVGVDSLLAKRLPMAGWLDTPGQPIDWATNLAVTKVMKSAIAAGLQVPGEEIAAWWCGRLGDGANDAPVVLRAKAMGAVMFKNLTRDGNQQFAAFLPAFDQMVANATDAGIWDEYSMAFVLFLRDAPVWPQWRDRRIQRQRPVDAPMLEQVGSIMLDALIHWDMRARVRAP